MLDKLCAVAISPKKALIACLLGLVVTGANANTINLASFTLTQSTFANGAAMSPDGGATLVLTGPNDGSGEFGYTDYVGTVASGGIFQFDWAFSTIDVPNYESAGYLIDGVFTELAAGNGASGSVSVPVLANSTIGFELQTVDNTGGPGVLTVSDFIAPPPLDSPATVPEAGSFGLMASALVFGIIYKLTRRHALLLGRPLVAISVVGGCLMLTQASRAATQYSYSGTDVTGSLVLTQTVNLTQQAQTQFSTSALSALSVEMLPKYSPRRLRPPSLLGGYSPIRRPGATARLAAPTASANNLTVTTPSGTTGFNALSHYDQRNADGGNQFSIEPPSQSIAASTNFILEGVNDAVQIFDASGNPLLSAVLSSNQVFGLAPAIDWNTGVNGVYMTDMKVFYDADLDRWFILQRDLDNDIYGNNLPTSHLWLAVSQTGDPRATYDIYVMDTTNPNHRGCPCLADYPQVGADQYGVYISWNEFNSGSSSFVDASILSLSKAALAAGALNPAAFQFFLPLATGYEFAITPSNTPPGAVNYVGPSSGGLEYFASTLSESAYNGGVAVWAMTNTSSLALTPNLVLTMLETPTLSYLLPGVATQCPGPLPYGSSQTPPGVLAFLDGGDNRVQSVTYSGGRLYVTFPSEIIDQNERYQVGGAFVVFSPTYRNDVLATSIVNQGYLFVNGDNLLRPTIAVNPQGSGAITATLVGPDYYPSAVVIPFSTFSTPSTLQIVGVGTLPEDGFTGYPGDGSVGVARWGDYNGAVATSDGAIWMVAQYIGTFPRTDYANWNTYVMRYQP